VSDSSTPVEGIIYDVELVKTLGDRWRNEPSPALRTKASQTSLKEAIQMHKRRGGMAHPALDDQSIERRGSSAGVAARFKATLDTLDSVADDAEKSIDRALNTVGDWMKNAASAQQKLDKQVADAAPEK